LSEYAFGAVDLLVSTGGDHHNSANHNGDEGEGSDEQSEYVDDTEYDGSSRGCVFSVASF
jgi:hypothetical protein